MSVSSTKTISSKRSLITLKVSCPGTFTEIPSAIVLAPPHAVTVPFLQTHTLMGKIVIERQ